MIGHWGAVVLAAIVLPGQALADDAPPIDAAQRLWEEAFGTGDGAKAAEMAFTEDARLLPDGAPVVEGREEIAAFWQTMFDAGARDLKLGTIAVEMAGDDTMIETGTWSVTVPAEGGGETRVSGKALVIWKRDDDGVFRMAQDMWNSDE